MKNQNTNDNKGRNNFKSNNNLKKKPNFVKVQLPLAYSDFYADCISSLYDLLDSISFDKVAIPVKMARSEILGDRTAKGSIIIGSIVKFNTDNTFTVSMVDDNAKYINDKCVVSCKCRKDFKENVINYITEFNVSERFVSIEDHDKDLADAFDTEDEPADETAPDTNEVAE